MADDTVDEELPLDEEDGQFHLMSATASFMKRDLKRIVGFCEVVMPSYSIDEFRLHVRTTKTTFEVLAQELAACTLENLTLNGSHVDASQTASHVTQRKFGVWPGTGFE